MRKLSASIAAALFAITAIPVASYAKVSAFAPGFSEKTVTVGERVVHYRIAGTGPTVLLIHGYADTGEMWAPLAPMLAKDHQVVVPDLPGLGASRPESATASYDMASVARSLHALMTQLKVQRAAVVGHDIGLMVAYAYA